MTEDMTVGGIGKTLDEWFPKRLAASWDNTGLLIGSKKSKIKKIMVCLTVTLDVCAEAEAWGAELIVSHHPLMFKPIQQITDDSPEGAIIRMICKNDVALYSPHTSHDGCLGGINDQIANQLGLVDTKPLFPALNLQKFKLVTFVPSSHLNLVSQALFAAGGGVIGKYSGCSFYTEGSGTFFGGKGTNPVLGTVGTAELVSEKRLEMVFKSQEIPEAISKLKSVHPYEEPAFDIYPLNPTPEEDGDGRIGHLETPTDLHDICKRLVQLLPVEMVQSVGHDHHQIKSIAIGCGASGNWIRAAKERHADLFIAGEMRYHDSLWAYQAGMAAIITGHYASESFAMKTLVTRLQHNFPQILIKHASFDHFPSHWVGKSEVFTKVV